MSRKLTRRQRAAGREPLRAYPPSLEGRLCATSPHALARSIARPTWRDRERARKADKAKRQFWEEQAADARARAVMPQQPVAAPSLAPDPDPARPAPEPRKARRMMSLAILLLAGITAGIADVPRRGR